MQPDHVRANVPAAFLLVVLSGAAALPGLCAQLHVAPPARIQEALDRAQPGDVVRVAAGVYRDRVQFKTSGTHHKPVTLQGEPGAILDGSEPLQLPWQPAPDVALGGFRAKLAFPAFTVVADGKIVTMLREDRVRPHGAKSGPAWEWPTLFKNGVGPSGWEGVKALALYLPQQKELLLRFGNNLDPRTMAITVAPKEPVVRIDGVNRCVVRGLALRAADVGVGSNNRSRLTWNRTNGEVSSWVLDPLGTMEARTDFGPFTNWSIRSTSAGTDGKSHLLWVNTDGRASVWTLGPGGGFEEGIEFGPFAGWTAVDIGVAADNTVRLMAQRGRALLAVAPVRGQRLPERAGVRSVRGPDAPGRRCRR